MFGLDDYAINDSNRYINYVNISRFMTTVNQQSFFFNPCQPFNLPKNDPHSGHGDTCLYVTVRTTVLVHVDLKS